MSPVGVSHDFGLRARSDPAPLLGLAGASRAASPELGFVLNVAFGGRPAEIQAGCCDLSARPCLNSKLRKRPSAPQTPSPSVGSLSPDAPRHKIRVRAARCAELLIVINAASPRGRLRPQESFVSKLICCSSGQVSNYSPGPPPGRVSAWLQTCPGGSLALAPRQRSGPPGTLCEVTPRVDSAWMLALRLLILASAEGPAHVFKNRFNFVIFFF